jgi:hypothetical protein
MTCRQKVMNMVTDTPRPGKQKKNKKASVPDPSTAASVSKIERLRRQERSIDAKRQRVRRKLRGEESKLRKAEKKAADRRRFLIGAAIESGAGSLSEAKLRRILDGFLKSDSDRAVFGLPPLAVATRALPGAPPPLPEGLEAELLAMASNEDEACPPSDADDVEEDEEEDDELPQQPGLGL